MTAPNPSYKPSEGKREEFRKYLEKNGVMDALTKVLVNLYEEVEKPGDALEYIRDRLSTLAGLETHKQLQQKIDELEEQVKQLSNVKEDEKAPEGEEEEAPPMDPGSDLPAISSEENKAEAPEPQAENEAPLENPE